MSQRWLLTCYFALTSTAAAQSGFESLFHKFEETGDLAAFTRDSGPLTRSSRILREDVNFLVSEQTAANRQLSEMALRELALVMYWHPLAYADQEQRAIFEVVVSEFERHLGDALAEENSYWRSAIASSAAYLGFPPSAGDMPLLYKMLDDKAEANERMAAQALARMKPMPEEAKAALFGMLQRKVGPLPGRQVLGALASAIEDPDVLAQFVKFADSSDVEMQTFSTGVLSGMRPIPSAAVEVFRRLQKRTDLDEQVASNVKAAIDELEGRARQ